MSADQAPDQASPIFGTRPDRDENLVSLSGERMEPCVPPPPTGGAKPFAPEIYQDRAVIVLALRLEGYTYKEIQKKTGLTDNQVRYACQQARRAGKLRDVIDLIDNEAVPQAVENLIGALRDEKHANHWDATKETLHGRGAFRRFNTNRQEGGAAGSALPSLQLVVVSPTGGALPTVIVNSDKGSVLGSPRTDEMFDDA